ncbi:mini-chromosome maintenance complex-binding protein-like [Dreissena polymorpha]|uniref:mini-chromosome maintenance complex-binding protein-like n=1 Tax=Dreissena polymorpha TaxID=45954 RepID=UPI00226463A6|nr:mini-chromosome maintenance complex-binding protein-like [Dreissena polymorpha]
MPSIEDWINDPLGIIQNIFDKQQNLESSNVKNYFTEKLKTKNALTWIPSLNDSSLHTLKPNSLVRFRCMVQDMFDPEFYLGSYEVKDIVTGQTTMKSGKYKDIAECGANQSIDLDSMNNKTMDRMTLYCVPVPGESNWVKTANTDMSKVKTKCYPSTSQTPMRCKRNRDNNETMETSPVDNSEDSCQGQPFSSVVGDTDIMEMDSIEIKRKQTNKSEPGSSKIPDLNFPLPSETGPACLVKVYDDVDSFKVNDVVEFVGVLSVDPSLAIFPGNGDGDHPLLGGVEESIEELHAHAPPPSLVPRLHAVLCNHRAHVNPLVPNTGTEEYSTVLENIQREVTTLREELLSILELSLLGDRLAAEYLLCNLVASVYGRADVMPLGKFGLNLSNCPSTPTYSQLLHHLISNLVTQTHLVHMSLDNMNKLPFSPHKDYTANRLCSGILQLACRTNLVLDETSLGAGQLDVQGVKNLAALGNLITWQKVEYDFNFHRQEFMADVSVLILSEGRSILPSDCLLPLQYSGAPDDLRTHFTQLDSRLTEDFLRRCRTYLGLARNLQYSMNDDIQKKIQDDFVDMRKDDPKNMTVDDFHSLLSLTRLLSLSDLKSSPTSEIWSRAKVLENSRKQRVSQLPTRERSA